MNLAFAGCEIYLDRQQLRLAGPIVHLNPQVHDLLTHLLRNRDRVVSKAELLDEATLFSPATIWTVGPVRTLPDLRE